MRLFEFKDTRVFFNDFKGHQQLILDYSPLKNYSSMPSYYINTKGYFSDNFVNWLSTIFIRASKLKTVGKITGNNLEYLVTSLFIIQQLVNKQRNFRVLEIGCDNGVLSVLIAEILKHFNSDNRLICVSEEQVNTEQDQWLKLMSTSSAIDIVSRYIGDFTELPFRENDFDLVIVNGTMQFVQAKSVFEQAALVLRNQGILYVIAELQTDLFALSSESLKNSSNYLINETTTVFFKKLSRADRKALITHTSQIKVFKTKRTIIDNLNIIKEPIINLSNLTAIELDEIIKIVSRTEDLVLNIFNQLISLKLKYYLNELKETLINYRLNLGIKSNLEKSCQRQYQLVLHEIKVSEDF